MDVSVIIPVYNNREEFERSLYFLSKQQVRESLAYEVIVVDDGSSEPIRQIAEKYQSKLPNLRYIYLERTPDSNRSRTRNTGIQASTGSKLLFLDCGILVPPNYVESVAGLLEGRPELVLLHYILGLFAEVNENEADDILRLTPESFEQFCDKMKYTANWEDYRAVSFESVQNDLDQLPAPWVLGWSGALSTSRELVSRTDGFDESFREWGAEDIDFSYQLYRNGGSFQATEHIKTLHLPHEVTNNDENKMRSSLRNKFKIHQKNGDFDTELYPFCADMYYNQLMGKYNRLLTKYFTPTYSESLMNELNTRYLSNGEGRSLLVGSDSHSVIQTLQTTHVFLQNKSIYEAYSQTFKDKNIVYALGINTFYEKHFFDVAIMTDYYRMSSLPMLLFMFKELLRISGKLVVIHTEDHHCFESGAGWLTWDQVTPFLRNYGFTFEKVEQSGRHSIMEITSSVSLQRMSTADLLTVYYMSL
ncbi:glycosyltransferase family 2 protein [Paenibacillus lutrae]|uniref:Glycosyltransferase n=1 Tax=Paenibacillus lutrae TaxID=2078573 RepID=A0A7X3FH48_9BACL|nr:glycosyltransferase family A protein [Paenibacillus lutrae]MVO99560.1 glycosyltransferase [Paenibacillus lutrae]